MKYIDLESLICSEEHIRASRDKYFKASITQKRGILDFLYDEVVVFSRELEGLHWDILLSRKLILQYHTQVGKVLTLSAKGYAELGLGNRVVSPDSCVEYMYKRALKNDLERKFFSFSHFQRKNVMVFKKDGVFYYATGSYRGLRASNIRIIYSKMKPFLISPSQLLVFHPRPYQVSHLVQDLTRLEILTLAV